MPIDHPLWK